MAKKIKKYGIIGFPLDHSLSPVIHNAAFAALGLSAEYEKIEISPNLFEEEIKKLKASDYQGFNVTVPYKEKIIPYLDEIDPVTDKIGAVNTVKRMENGSWKGYNTDYIGFIAPILNDIDSINSCLIIGAGGAARAVGFGLLKKSTLQKLDLVNRTEDKAKKLLQLFRSVKEFEGRIFSAEIVTDISISYDLIVQTTSVGMGKNNRELPMDPVPFFHERTIVYDLIYNPEETVFLKKARDRGLRSINGWPMLIKQAQAAFNIWTGLNAPDFTQNKYNEIRQLLLEQ